MRVIGGQPFFQSAVLRIDTLFQVVGDYFQPRRRSRRRLRLIDGEFTEQSDALLRGLTSHPQLGLSCQQGNLHRIGLFRMKRRQLLEHFQAVQGLIITNESVGLQSQQPGS